MLEEILSELIVINRRLGAKKAFDLLASGIKQISNRLAFSEITKFVIAAEQRISESNSIDWSDNFFQNKDRDLTIIKTALICACTIKFKGVSDNSIANSIGRGCSRQQVYKARQEWITISDKTPFGKELIKLVTDLTQIEV